MKIDRIEISKITLNLDKPVSTAYGSFSTQDLVIVKLRTSDGLWGYGEVPASGTLNYGGFSPESVASDIANSYANRLVGTEFDQPLDLLRFLERPVSRSQEEREISSRAPVDMAVFDIQGKLNSKPVSELLGKRCRDELEVGHILSAESPESMAEEAATASLRGCRSLKAKLSGEPSEDRKRVQTIRSSVGDQAILWVDPNEQWSVNECATWCKSLNEDCRVDYVEQPIPGWDFEGLAKLRKEIQPVRVIADQSVYSVHDAERIVALKAADVITIKTMRLGISKAAKVAEISAKAGLGCKIGAGGEGPVGGAAAICISQIATNLADCNELSFPRYRELPFEGLIQGSRGEWTWKVEEAPGLGVKPKRAFKETLLVKMPS